MAAKFKGGRLFHRVELRDFEPERAALKREAEEDAEADELPVVLVSVLVTEKE